MNLAKTSVWIVTLYLAVYTGLFQLGASATVLACMFLLSPFLIVRMVYALLIDPFEYPELKDGEEWGYRDKAKQDLGMF